MEIPEDQWGYGLIREVDRDRAERLASAGTPEQLIQELADALHRACHAGELRIGIDSKDNLFTECRSIVQFKTTPQIYDWFFNSRTGYRSRFWITGELGLQFNAQLVEQLRSALSKCLPSEVLAHRIEMHGGGNDRTEIGAGVQRMTLGSYLRSLEPQISKVWICERLIQESGGPSQQIGFAVLSAAEKTTAKLDVPRWANASNPETDQPGEGLRAPYPNAADAWIDLKGGFVGRNDVEQIKPPMQRALSIRERGWT